MVRRKVFRYGLSYKTTTNINLSYNLSSIGKKVLVIDLDPQGNTTSGLGIDKNSVEKSLYDLLMDDISINECIIKSKYENLDVIASNISLTNASIEMVDIPNRENRLKKAIRSVNDEYEYIFIDCPPSLGLLTINALVASNSILIPIQCEYFALEGVSSLLQTYELIRKSLNKELSIAGILLCMYDGRTNLSKEVKLEVIKYFKDSVFKTVIPKNIKLAESPSHGLPVKMYAPKSSGSKAYMKLTKELIKRI